MRPRILCWFVLLFAAALPAVAQDATLSGFAPATAEAQRTCEARRARLSDGPPANAAAINETLLSLEQAFQYADGLQFGDQYRSLYASPNPFNGYASWMLPGLRYPVETDASAEALARWTEVYRASIATLTERVRTATEQLRRE